LADLTTVYVDVRGSFDAELDAAAIDPQDRDEDVVADTDSLLRLST